jgi:hypothetical protein
MKKNTPKAVLAAVLLTVAFFACKKTNDDTKFISYKSYVNPVKGKYIIYRLDSTVTKDFGAGFITKSYTIKDSVANVFKDNTGRESFTIYRLQLINPSNNSWRPINTFVVTPRDNSLEYVENNLRYVLLANPISDLKTWRGNSDIQKSPFYKNSTIYDWDFFYTDIEQPKTIGGLNFNNTITVVQSDSTENKAFNPLTYYTYQKGYEIYADSLGLVYKDVMVYEYQQSNIISNCKLIKPKTTGAGFDTVSIDCSNSNNKCDSLKLLPNYKIICDTSLGRFAYDGYGIKQTILSHN